MRSTRSYRMIFLIGAARSGTKILRDIIAEHPVVDKVPYDINYIWRMGNERQTHDEMSPGLLTPRVSKRILKHVDSFSRGAPQLIEKTVSNCLRIQYIHNVYPNALYIHLIRNGWDVVESTYRQWIAPPKWNYILRKALSYPVFSAFGYALDYAKGILQKMIARDKGAGGIWGPRYEGILEDVNKRDLIEVCALQWARSVENTMQGLKTLQVEKSLTIRYEDFVRHPREKLELVSKFIGLDPSHYFRMDLTSISQTNIGKGIRNLSHEQVHLVLPLIRNSLLLLGYAEDLN